MLTFLEMMLKESGSAVLLRIALVSGGEDLTEYVLLYSMLSATSFSGVGIWTFQLQRSEIPDQYPT